MQLTVKNHKNTKLLIIFRKYNMQKQSNIKFTDSNIGYKIKEPQQTLNKDKMP